MCSGTTQRKTTPPSMPVNCARSSVLSSLPVALRGSSATKCTSRGHLKCASRSRHHATISSALGARRSALGARRLCRRVGDHDRDDAFAPLRVLTADHGGVEHRRVAEENLLDLDRVDVLAAGDDHVLLAVDEGDEALGVHAPEVARVEPAPA